MENLVENYDQIALISCDNEIQCVVLVPQWDLILEADKCEAQKNSNHEHLPWVQFQSVKPLMGVSTSLKKSNS